MPATQQMSRLVDSPDGVRIAVYHEGNPDGPTVVLVHGFPPARAVRCRSAAGRTVRIARHDNRGVGRSSVPKPISAYTMAHFADDFDAVIGELSPGEPVHVLAHDWGSVGVWESTCAGPEPVIGSPRSRRCPAPVKTTWSTTFMAVCGGLGVREPFYGRSARHCG